MNYELFERLGLKEDYTAPGLRVKMQRPNCPPVYGVIMEAWADAQGLYHYIKVRTPDGISTEEASDIVINVVETAKPWLPVFKKIAFWVKNIFTRREKRKR